MFITTENYLVSNFRSYYDPVVSDCASNRITHHPQILLTGPFSSLNYRGLRLLFCFVSSHVFCLFATTLLRKRSQQSAFAYSESHVLHHRRPWWFVNTTTANDCIDYFIFSSDIDMTSKKYSTKRNIDQILHLRRSPPRVGHWVRWYIMQNFRHNR